MMEDAALHTALAGEQIADLLALWCEAFNAGDMALMGSLFCVAGEMEIGETKGDAFVVAASLAAKAGDWRASTANECVAISGDEALVESYIFLTGDTGGGLARHHAGRALDRFVGGRDGWRFTSRRIVIDWRLDALEHAP